MNIFYVDKDPKLAAQSLGDKHVVKMILESAQMLSTAHNINGSMVTVPYKVAYKNHPSTVWARQSVAQYDWLFEHFRALCKEYTFRYGKIHKCEQYTTCFSLYPFTFSLELPSFEPPPLCMPDVYKIGDAVTSYREYYKVGKAHLHKYTKREKPEWL